MILSQVFYVGNYCRKKLFLFLFLNTLILIHQLVGAADHIINGFVGFMMLQIISYTVSTVNFVRIECISKKSFHMYLFNYATSSDFFQCKKG